MTKNETTTKRRSRHAMHAAFCKDAVKGFLTVQITKELTNLLRWKFGRKFNPVDFVAIE